MSLGEQEHLVGLQLTLEKYHETARQVEKSIMLSIAFSAPTSTVTFSKSVSCTKAVVAKFKCSRLLSPCLYVQPSEGRALLYVVPF